MLLAAVADADADSFIFLSYLFIYSDANALKNFSQNWEFFVLFLTKFKQRFFSGWLFNESASACWWDHESLTRKKKNWEIFFSKKDFFLFLKINLETATAADADADADSQVNWTGPPGWECTAGKDKIFNHLFSGQTVNLSFPYPP